MNPEDWPHKFIKDGNPIQESNGNILQPYLCVHCDRRWLSGKEVRPSGKCPARNTRSEYRRMGIE